MSIFINLNKGLIMESVAKMDHIYTDTIRRVKESLVRERSPLTGSARHSLYKTLLWLMLNISFTALPVSDLIVLPIIAVV